MIAAVSDAPPYRFKAKYNPGLLNESGLERGYLVLISLNIINREVKMNYVTFRPISVYDIELDRRNLVYANDAARIYYTGNVTVEFHNRANASVTTRG